MNFLLQNITQTNSVACLLFVILYLDLEPLTEQFQADYKEKQSNCYSCSITDLELCIQSDKCA